MQLLGKLVWESWLEARVIQIRNEPVHSLSGTFCDCAHALSPPIQNTGVFRS